MAMHSYSACILNSTDITFSLLSKVENESICQFVRTSKLCDQNGVRVSKTESCHICCMRLKGVLVKNKKYVSIYVCFWILLRFQASFVRTGTDGEFQVSRSKKGLGNTKTIMRSVCHITACTQYFLFP